MNKDIINPPQGISNISEWCKKDACWARLVRQYGIDRVANLFAEEFSLKLLPSAEDNRFEAKSARQVQKIDDGIEAQKQVLAVAAGEWSR